MAEEYIQQVPEQSELPESQNVSNESDTPDPKKRLWQGLSDKKMYTKSYEDFQNQFNNQQSIDRLYKGLSDKKLYTKGNNDFYSQFFPDVKKKETTGQSSKAGSTQDETGIPTVSLSPSPSQKTSQQGQSSEDLSQEGKDAWEVNPLNPMAAVKSAEQSQPKKDPIKGVDNFGIDLGGFYSSNKSDKTYIPKPADLVEQKRLSELHKEKVAKAIDNTTKKALAAKGIKAEVNSPAYTEQKKKIQQDFDNGDVTYQMGKDGEPGLNRTTGFWESLKNGWNESVNANNEADNFVNNMTTEQRVEFANKKKEEQKDNIYLGQLPGTLGSFGQLIGENAPFLGKAAAGTAIGTGLVLAAPETAGASLEGLPSVVAFAATTPDMVYQGGMQETLRRYNQLKKENPESNDVDLMRQAEEGMKVGEVAGGVTNMLLMGTAGNNPISQEGKNVIGSFVGNSLKSAAHMGAVSAGVEAGKEIIGAAQGIKTTPANVIENAVNSFKDNATLGLALHGVMSAVTGLTKVPKSVTSAFKYALKDENPIDIQNILQANEQQGTIPQGATQAVMTDLAKYNEALNKTAEGLTPEAQASVAGLMQKRNDLQAEMATKDFTQLQPYQEKIDAINKQIEGITKTNNPFAFEVDDTTGKPLDGTISDAPVVKENKVGEHEELQPLPEQKKEGDQVYRVDYRDQEGKPAHKYFNNEEESKTFFQQQPTPMEGVTGYYEKLPKGEIVETVKTTAYDKENIPGVPSGIGVGEEPIQAKPIEGGGTQEIGDRGDIQAQGAEGEGEGVEQKVGEVEVPKQIQEQPVAEVSKQQIEETNNLLNDGDNIRKEGRYVKDGVEYVRNEKGLGIKSEQGGDVRFTSEPGGGGVVAPFKYKLVEANTLQPSHQDGLRNPNHFIWEAQPKNRNDVGSIQAEESFANNPRFNEMGENTNAYSGAPVVNERNEVIQGNNRSAGIKKGYQRGNETYKKALADNAEKFGFTKEQVEGMENPVLVREVAASDKGAIELGNYDVKDLESGGKRRLDPITITRRMPFDLKGRISDILFKGDETLNQAIRSNTKRLMELIDPYLNQAQRNTIFKDGLLTDAGAKDLEAVVQHFLFDGGDTALPELFDNLSHTQKEGLRKALPHIFSTKSEKSIVPEVQEAILALNDFGSSESGDFNNWLSQSDMFNDGMTPRDKYSPTSIKIAEILHNAKSQKEITSEFGKYAESVNDKPATLYEDEVKGVSKKEGIKQIFKTDYDESKKPKISTRGGEEVPRAEEKKPQPVAEGGEKPKPTRAVAEPGATKPRAATGAEPGAISPAAEPAREPAKPSEPAKIGKFEEKAKKIADKIMKAELPDWLTISDKEAKKSGVGAEDLKQMLADAVVKMGRLLDQGVEFSQALKESVKDIVGIHGEENRDNIEKGFEKYYKDNVGEEKVSGVKKAITEPLREKFGLPKVELPKMGSDVEELNKAKERVDSGISNPREMVDDIIKNDRGYKNENEVMDMQYYAHQLDAKDRELTKMLADADNDIEKAAVLGLKQQLSDEIDRQTEAALRAGNKWGKIGKKMQPVIDDGFNISRERNMIKEAYGGELPEQVKMKIESITKERDEAIAEREKIEKKLVEERAKKEVEKKSKETKKEAKPKKNKEDYIKERKSIVDRIKKKWNDAKGGGALYSSVVPIPIEKVKQLAAISPEVGELIKSHIEEGVDKLNDIVDSVHALLKDDISELTKKDVLDLISGKYTIGKERSDLAKKVADIRSEAKKLEKEGRTDDEKIKNEIDKLNRRADNLEEKLKNTPSSKVKEEFNPYNNSEWIKADQRVVNAEKKMRDLKRQAFESQKNWFQKSLMWAGRGIRLSLLTGYNVLAKLGSAATIGAAVKRIPEQAIGSIYNTIFKSVAEKAPIEGSSMNLNSELKWYKEFFNPKKFVKNSWDILKTGTTYLNKKMGKGEYEHVPILYLPTDLHQIIKDPVKRSTYEASFANAMRHAEKNGLDINNDLVVQSIQNAAFKRAEYEIFQESNSLTRKFTAFKNEMEKKGDIGAAGKFLADFMIPISSVPTNIARRLGITSPFGLLKASYDVRNAYRKGIENLTPEQADKVMRQLKQGTMGTALWLIGWYAINHFGGLYTKYNPNKKRDDEDLASDEMVVGGKSIPKPVQHALPLEIIQLAATSRRLWDKYREDKETSTAEDIYNAGLASIGTVVESIPVIETPVHMVMATTDPYEATKMKEDIKGRFQPQILKETGIIKKDGGDRKFSEEEMSKFSELSNSGLNIPEIGTRKSIRVNITENHPDGTMTQEEYDKFVPLVKQYSEDNYKNIIDENKEDLNRINELTQKESLSNAEKAEKNELKRKISNLISTQHNDAIKQAKSDLNLNE